MRGKSNWLDEALGINVNGYLKTGESILKMQKFIFAFDKESLVKLRLFMDKLKVIHNHVISLEYWRKCASSERYTQHRKFIEEAPDIMKNTLKEISYVGE